jgi:hypothetical protein
MSETFELCSRVRVAILTYLVVVQVQQDQMAELSRSTLAEKHIRFVIQSR